jgi:adenosylhomocysteine nucleosidase
MVAITFALPAESSEFVRRLDDKSNVARAGIKIIRGRIGDREIQLMHTGVGERTARERLARFLQDQEFEFLLSTGFAGALTEELVVGDLLVAKNFSTLELSAISSSLSDLRICVADLVTLPALIDSTDERNTVARSTGAAAVDMETEFIARACAKHGMPLLSLRIITDSPVAAFPAPPQILFDIERQRTRALKFATFFLAHPHRVPKLIQFARRISRVRKTLADALVTVVREL